MATLTNDTVEECQRKFDLSYHVPYALDCLKRLGFEGKDILEVGGSLPGEFVFDYLGAKTWTAIEAPEYAENLAAAGGLTHKGTMLHKEGARNAVGYSEAFAERYVFNYANIEDLPEDYTGKFDLVFSIATFEHLSKLTVALDNIHRALKPGGVCFSIFCPIWSSYDGHHLPHIEGLWHDGECLIPPWAHLILTPPKMLSFVESRTGRQTAELATYYIYNSPHINRFFFDDYEGFIDQTPFREKQLDGLFPASIPSETAECLGALYPTRRGFEYNGMRAILTK